MMLDVRYALKFSYNCGADGQPFCFFNVCFAFVHISLHTHNGYFVCALCTFQARLHNLSHMTLVE